MTSKMNNNDKPDQANLALVGILILIFLFLGLAYASIWGFEWNNE